MERGEIALNAEFFARFGAELASADATGLDIGKIFADIAIDGGVHHNMAAIIYKIRAAGYRVAALFDCTEPQ